jgi:Tol biopolymer transport system component
MMDLDGSNKTNLTKTPRLRENFPDFSPNGSQICFFRESDSSGKSVPGIYVMDADGSDPTLLFKTDSPELFDWSPAGKKIALSRFIDSKKDDPIYSDREVYVINADGSGGTALTRNSALDETPAWSPDGTKITFASDMDGDKDIYTMDAHGSDVAQVTNLPGDEGHPDWQPLPGTTVHQPDTGGPSLLWAASALLFAGGSLLYAGVRRSI